MPLEYRKADRQVVTVLISQRGQGQGGSGRSREPAEGDMSGSSSLCLKCPLESLHHSPEE